MQPNRLRIIVTILIILFLALNLQPGTLAAQAQSSPAQFIKPLPGRDVRPAAPRAAAGMLSSDGADIASIAGWTKIAYQSYKDGDAEIYVANGGGADVRVLTHNEVADYGPRMNRDASRLVFASDRDGNTEIYTSLIDGQDQVRLTNYSNADYAPDWSPDGSKIVFVSRRDGNPELYLMNSDGSGQVRLTYNRNTDINPAWSPDGQQIAWVRVQESSGEVWVMNADGGNQHLLVSERPYLGAVAWSPDGTKLICDYDYDGDFWNELMLFSSSGVGLRQIYDANQNFVDVWTGSFSPDGKWFVYNRVEYGVSGNELYINYAYIETLWLEYGSPTRLPGVGLEMDPHWQTADLTAPISHVTGLAPHTHAGDFPVIYKGYDLGPAGITGYELQYRIGEQGLWTNWYLTDPMSLKTVFLIGNPGERVYFRTRAVDAAGNLETWPSEEGGDASTWLYTWEVAGALRDNRGAGLIGSLAQISPAPVDLTPTGPSGGYTAWLQSEGEHTLQAALPGYSTFPPVVLNLSSNYRYDRYLPPSDDFAINGGFENSVVGWQISGTVNITAPALAHSGQHALVINEFCLDPCLTEPDPFMDAFTMDITTMKDGTVVVMYDYVYVNPPALYILYLPPGGAWSSPELVTAYPHSIFGSQLGIAVDGNDIIHAVWRGGEELYYTNNANGGSWSTLQKFTGFALTPAIAADSHGGVHVVYWGEDDAIYYHERDLDGTWKPPVRLNDLRGYDLPGIAVGPDDTVHFIWQEITSNNTALFTRSRTLSGELTSSVKLFEDIGHPNPLRIIAGPSGELHAFWKWGFDAYYAYRPPGENWGEVELSPYSNGYFDVTVDSKGALHLIVYKMDTSTGKYISYYSSKRLEIGWTDAVLFPEGFNSYKVRVDNTDRLHLLGGLPDISKMAYQTTRLAEASSTNLARQQVTVPTDAHHPTLSLFHKLDRFIPGGGSRFDIGITDSLGESTVITPSAGATWEQSWLDLEPWLGETVTITFRTQQAAGEPLVQPVIDDVSLGSWLTPVVAQVSPAWYPGGWASQALTITGANFIPGAAVLLDNIPLTGIQWIDQNTLQAVIPSGLQPGVYDLWVVNPGQQRSLLSRSVTLGHTVYLPLLKDTHMGE